MDYFQGVVAEYLRADRATFINTECLIQLDEGDSPGKGRHWYCDILAVNFRDEAVYLCEVTYSQTLYALIRRLQAWNKNWTAVCAALRRDCLVPKEYKIVPWAFVPEDRRPIIDAATAFLQPEPAAASMPRPLITALEEIVPWKYHTWDRKVSDLASEREEADKAAS